MSKYIRRETVFPPVYELFVQMNAQIYTQLLIKAGPIREKSSFPSIFFKIYANDISFVSTASNALSGYISAARSHFASHFVPLLKPSKLGIMSACEFSLKNQSKLSSVLFARAQHEPSRFFFKFFF